MFANFVISIENCCLSTTILVWLNSYWFYVLIISLFYFQIEVPTAATTESIQFDGRALTLGLSVGCSLPQLTAQTICTNTATTVSCTQVPLSSPLVLACTKNISLPSFSSPTSAPTPAPAQQFSTDINQSPKSADTLTKLNSNEHSTSPVPSSVSSALISNNLSFNNIIQKLLGSPTHKNYTDYHQNQLQNPDKSNANMPPPNPDSPSTVHKDTMPRKRRRKREDPQSCFTSSEVSLIRLSVSSLIIYLII